MENGLTDVHLVSLPKEVDSLKSVESPYPVSVNIANNGRSPSSSRTPSPNKKCQELMFIDDGTNSSSSSSLATSMKEREKQRQLSSERDKSAPRQGTVRTTDQSSFPALSPTPSLPPPAPPPSLTPAPPLISPLPPTSSSHDLSELTLAPARRLPTVVVLGYQRAVVESQAAAERMHQQQQQKLQQQQKSGPHPTDCPLTLSIGSSGLIDHGLPSPHGRNNRVITSVGIDAIFFIVSPQKANFVE